MQFAKAAPPGFERETRGRPIVTLSFVVARLNQPRHHGQLAKCYCAKMYDCNWSKEAYNTAKVLPKDNEYFKEIQ